jgi:hypothetical protein
VNIGIFYVSATATFLFERWAFRNGRMGCGYPWLAFLTVCLIGALFVVFTFSPPEIPLFRDPVTGSYGI